MKPILALAFLVLAFPISPSFAGKKEPRWHKIRSELAGTWLYSSSVEGVDEISKFTRKNDGTFVEEMLILDFNQKTYSRRHFEGQWNLQDGILVQVDGERGFYSFIFKELNDKLLTYTPMTDDPEHVIVEYRISKDYKLPDPPNGYQDASTLVAHSEN